MVINDLIEKHLVTNETRVSVIKCNGDVVSGFYHSDVVIPYINKELKSYSWYMNNSIVAELRYT